MITPIKCFTCGKTLGHLYEPYKMRVENGEDPEEVLDDLEVERYCCRRMFLTHEDLIDEVMKY